MIRKSKEFEDVGRVASSFPTYLGKIEATLLAGYARVVRWLQFFNKFSGIYQLTSEIDSRFGFRVGVLS